MATPLFDARELPILEAIAKREEETGGALRSSDELPELTGLAASQVEAGLRSLLDAQMIKGIDITTHGGFGLLNIRLRERGRVATHQWPADDAYDELLQRLEVRLACH